ncbi:MAG: PAS domain-containing protein, partial [Clostridia bacterium]|nr:PAS domain-containing protein [Clostridia bacterium]
MVDNGLFSFIFENMVSGAAIYEVKNDGLYGRDYIIKDFNKISRDIENVTREEVIGKSLFDLRPTIDEYGLIEVFRRVWKTGEPAKFPSKQYVDESYSNWYENHVFKLPTGEIVAMYNDVTEKELGMIEINKKNQLLKEVIENAPYGVFIVDGSGRYKEVNKKACEQTGYTRKELGKMNVSDLLVTDPSGNRDNDFRYLK